MPKTFNNIIDITNEWSRAICLEIYKRSQELVPVKSGALKASGSVSLRDRGGSIVYDAPHAGSNGRNQSGGDYIWKVKSHRRTLKSGKSVMVRDYTRRVPQITSSTKTTKPTKNNFLDKAAEEVMADTKLLERLWLRVGGGSPPAIKSDDKAPY